MSIVSKEDLLNKQAEAKNTLESFTSVLKNDSCLLIQERNVRRMWTGGIMITIKQSAYRLTFHNSTLYDFLTVFHLYMHILIIVRLDFHKRSKFAKSLASGLNNTDMRNIFLHFHAYPVKILAQFRHLVINLLCAGSDTSGTGTDKHTTGKRLNLMIISMFMYR